jgi:hypothetical protein
MRKWLILVGLCLPCPGESWHQVVERLSQSAPSSVTSSEDLDVLRSTLRQLSTWGQGQDGLLPATTLRDSGQRLERARKRFEWGGVEPAWQGWLAEVAQVEKSLLQASQSFDGFRCLSEQQWAQAPWGGSWAVAEFASPNELLRAARALRIDLQSITRPCILPGQSLGYAAGWPGGSELQRVLMAAQRFEDSCAQRYTDVSTTQKAYSKLLDAWGRLQSVGPLDPSGLRSVERGLQRLDRFYASLSPN